MNYTIYAYKNAENSNPTEAINRSANWVVGHFTTTSALTLADVEGNSNPTTGNDMTAFNLLVDAANNMADMFGYSGDIGFFVTDDDNGEFIGFAVHAGGEWVEPCKYCEGWCTIDPDHACDGSQGDIDELDAPKCPECGGVMKFAMLPDSVGNGLHEGHECTDCGHAE